VIDAFLVRTLLVPSLIALVGPISAWPGRLRPPVPVVAPPPLALPAPAPPASGVTRAVLVLIGIVVALSAFGRRR
jgi:uncharacterized membrane protein YdfJ with MMPL/SSD domain